MKRRPESLDNSDSVFRDYVVSTEGTKGIDTQGRACNNHAVRA